MHKQFSVIMQESLIALLFIFSTQAIIANAVTVKDFSKHQQFYNIKISPDGKKFAALINSDGGKRLVFLDAATNKLIYALNASKDSQPGDYYWANNERVVIQIERLIGSLEQPVSSGEIFAVNYDGKKAQMIYGYRSKRQDRAQGILTNLLPNKKKHVLIQSYAFAPGTVPKVMKLNIYTGRTKRVKIAPLQYGNFLIDHDGSPRFFSGLDNDNNVQLFYSAKKGDKWQNFGKQFKGEFTPVTFSKDNKSIYAFKSEHGQTQGLYKYNLDTKKATLLYHSDLADPSQTLNSNLGDTYGVRIDEDYPKYIYLDKNSIDAKLHKALYASFKGNNITITSSTKNGQQIVVAVSGDKSAGDFYLFNTKNMQAKFLFSAAPWLKSSEMAAMEPFRLKTKDGLTLNGYITLPKGKTKNLPTVILPHGGPHLREYWGFNTQAQMLANAGYAVVQVNYRGSTGYGKNFMESGYKNWGTKIQDDILLAAKYAISQGISDKKRLCIFGASFGGYSALQSAIRFPDFYQCAIGYAGVYDLPLLYNKGDIKAIKWGDAYLDKTLGTNVDEQLAQSPVYHVDKLKVPILIMHGEDDHRAPLEHAIRLRAALDKTHHPYEWLVKDKEGHGFYNEENILEANKAILAFLEKHIGH